MSARFVIGIDLGTTSSVVSFVDLQEATPVSRVFSLLQEQTSGVTVESQLLPSLLHLPPEGGAEKVGLIAREQLAYTPERVIQSAKSWLIHAGVDREARILPWMSQDLVAKDERRSPVEVASALLSFIRGRWDQQFVALRESRGEAAAAFNQQRIFITVPASFDEVAQRLTLRAAELAGYPTNTRLLEEPQAAFYAWLEQHVDDASDSALPGITARPQHVLVCDLGGGTTDFSFFRVSQNQTSALKIPIEIERIAVGEHLLLGGDNIDLAVAHALKSNLPLAEVELSERPWSYLVQQARNIKERVLSEPELEAEFFVSLPTSGSALFAGAKTASITPATVRELVLEGFFPLCRADEQPQRSQRGLREWGLPYASDAAFTKHLAEFVRAQGRIDAVLFAGGTLKPELLRHRLLQLIASWQGGETPVLLSSLELELSVSRGAAYGGYLLSEVHAGIGGGYPRSIYIGVNSETTGQITAVCVLPRGAHENQELEIDRQFMVVVDQPVRFPVYSAIGKGQDQAGDIVEINEYDFHHLPPLQTVIRHADQKKRRKQAQSVPVNLVSKVSHLGLLELQCRERLGTEAGAARSWTLTFNAREERDSAEASVEVPSAQISEPKLRQASALIEGLYGKKQRDEYRQLHPKQLFEKLEETLGLSRSDWDAGLLRSLWPALEEGITRRGRSVPHEIYWLMVAGFVLRPGYGLALDSHRMDELWRCFQVGVAFPKESRSLLQYWIMWRRVAGGLTPERQLALYQALRIRLREAGPDLAEAFRLCGALERLPQNEKESLVRQVVANLLTAKAAEVDYLAWTLGRLLNREPLYASPHTALSRALVLESFAALTALNWGESHLVRLNWTFSRAARLTGDRARDLLSADQARISRKLESSGATAEQLKLLHQVVRESDEVRSSVWGEELPSGLSLSTT